MNNNHGLIFISWWFGCEKVNFLRYSRLWWIVLCELLLDTRYLLFFCLNNVTDTRSTTQNKLCCFQRSFISSSEFLSITSLLQIEQIQTEYKARALANHPDKCAGNTTEYFQTLSRAKDVLTDPDKRRTYDNWLRCGINIPYEEYVQKKVVNLFFVLSKFWFWSLVIFNKMMSLITVHLAWKSWILV